MGVGKGNWRWCEHGVYVFGCWGGGSGLFSWPQIVLPESQERTSSSQGHTVRGGGGGPRNPGFAAEVHSVGVEGVGRSPRNSQLSFFSEGARWVKEKWVG